MGIYFLFMVTPIIIWLILSFLYKKPFDLSNSFRCRYLFIYGVILFLMLALRHYSVGSGDGEWYYSTWKYMSTVSIHNLGDVLKRINVEKGYLLSVWLLAHVFRAPQFIFVFYGLLVSCAVCNFVHKNCRHLVVALIMFNCLGLWGFMVQGIRQGIAICICLFAIEYCKERKLFRFLLLVILAASFHASAIVFAIVYFFPNLKMNLTNYIAVGVGAIVAFFSIEKVFFLLNYVIKDAYLIGDTDRTSGGFISAVIYILLIFATLFFYTNKKIKQDEITLFFNMLCCGFLIFMMRYSVNTIAQRVMYYFMFSQMPIMSLALEKIKGTGKNFITMLIICLCLGITIYKASYSVLVPYYFFWQG